MGQAGRYLRRTSDGYSHWCPACENMHGFWVDKPTSKGARWQFNGDLAAPTFTPSMNIGINQPDHPHYVPDEPSERCHYILTAGQIQFCGDCTHDMKGMTVPLPVLPEEFRDPS